MAKTAKTTPVSLVLQDLSDIAGKIAAADGCDLSKLQILNLMAGSLTGHARPDWSQLTNSDGPIASQRARQTAVAKPDVVEKDTRGIVLKDAMTEQELLAEVHFEEGAISISTTGSPSVFVEMNDACFKVHISDSEVSHTPITVMCREGRMPVVRDSGFRAGWFPGAKALPPASDDSFDRLLSGISKLPRDATDDPEP